MNEEDLISLNRSYDSSLKQTGHIKEKYWRTIPINSSLHNLILEIKKIFQKPGALRVSIAIKCFRMVSLIQ